MPETSTEVSIVHTNQVEQQAIENIRQQLKQATGETHQVQPVTAQTPLEIKVEGEGDSVEEFYNRAVWGRPGQEPSKSFLKKLWERMKKKHPEKEVKLR